MAGNKGGPWGSGSGGSGSGGDDDRGGGRRPEQGSIPEIDEIMKKGQEQLRVLMGGRGGRRVGGGGGGGEGPKLSKGTWVFGGLVAAALWVYASAYTVKPDEQSVELMLGKFHKVGEPGLNFAPWPVMTYDVIPVTRTQTEDIGIGRNGTSDDDGLMLTTDENIVDIDFRVFWIINDPAKYLFNLRDGSQTVRAVSESAMRDIVAGSELAPLLNRDRALVAQRARELIQQILDGYDSGIEITSVNLNKADPPREVIDSFREVQAAEQERDRLERQADAYSNRVVAGARGEAEQVKQQSEAYRAQVVNEARGEASRFTAVLGEYKNAPDVTRRRLYIETMERVLGGVDKIILDDKVSGSGGGQGVVPYLPLNELRRSGNTEETAPAAGGN